MKTWDIDFSGSRVEAIGPTGEFVKTADHFEAVAEYETALREARAQVDLLQKMRARDLSQMSALVEQLAKGVAVQAPGPL